MRIRNAVIIDGYVDEPACLGVPPYISPYPRYIAGSLVETGLPEENIHYFTIDQLRGGVGKEILGEADLIVVIAGITVPGKYLRATPITLREIMDIGRTPNAIKILGGPIRLGYGEEGGKAAFKLEISNMILAQEDLEAYVYDVLRENSEIVSHRRRTNEEIRRWSRLGAFIIKKHPDYPHLMCEIETYRGCPRHLHCSFCTEPFYGVPYYRAIMDVVGEIGALYQYGARYFRIGRQPDLFAYHGIDVGEDVPKPNPEGIKHLYAGIRRTAPEIKVLHMDNANPATIARFPAEAREVAKTIVKYHTPGDVAALGMESADPEVIKANNLKASPEEVFEAIKLLNEVGARRGLNGMPELLPGINFVHGLKKETKETFRLNLAFMKKVLESGLLVRRVNIRQVISFPNTSIYGYKPALENKAIFQRYKEKFRIEIDLPMLRRVVPIGTILRDVRTEVIDGNLTYARQLASYPILVGIPSRIKTGIFLDILVTDHGMRSLTGIPYPLDINTSPQNLIEQLPGVGKKRAQKIIGGRPYRNLEDFAARMEKGKELSNYIIV